MTEERPDPPDHRLTRRRAEGGLKGIAGSGFDGKIVLGVDPKASPAEV